MHVSSALGQSGATITCPACGGANPADAIFCGNPACRKALGEYRFITEEMRAETEWHERLAGRVARFVGQPAFLVIHVVWFALWVLANSGAFGTRFDEYPFNLLGIVLAIEAVFITGLLLIDDSREDARANKLAELDYEINVLTYRRLQAIEQRLDEMSRRLNP